LETEENKKIMSLLEKRPGSGKKKHHALSRLRWIIAQNEV